MEKRPQKNPLNCRGHGVGKSELARPRLDHVHATTYKPSCSTTIIIRRNRLPDGIARNLASMASLAPTVADAATDVELDSTGAGSPPVIPLDEPPSHGAAGSTDRADALTSASNDNAAQYSSRTSLEAALGEVLVISGGSGYNDLVGATPGATYVMPISDNGGSSSEIIRVLGGPSIGDLRSRLNRLIPTPSRHDLSSSTSPAPPPPSNEAIHNLLSYRLPSSGSSRAIKQEWMDILEGRHVLWRGIEPERKEVIRGFLVQFESEVLRRAHRHFNFRGGSIGNFFLAAAQKFFRSIQSAIFLFSATTQISDSLASKVLPVINTNHTATIAAELEDGEIIVGQCEISHPAPKVQWEKRGVPRMPGGPLAEQAPETPSSAVWDVQRDQHQDPNLLTADAMQGLGLADGGPSTPGFGPPAHFHMNEPFASSNYTSMNGSVDAIREADASRGSTGKLASVSAATPARGLAAGASPLFAQLVDERAAAYAAQARKGLTTVGDLKDGLDPEDDDADSQDGQPESPAHYSAAEDDAASQPSLPRAAERTGEKTGNLIFTKEEDASSLPSPIARLLYVNAYRNEIHPAPNPSFLAALGRSRTLIYSCGSLWTSIVPCLALRSVATSIATSPTLRWKVLLLNSVQDRETRGMDARRFVDAICGSLNRSDPGEWQVERLITHVVYFEDGQVAVDEMALEEMGVRCVRVEPRLRGKGGTPKFDEGSVREALAKITAS